MKVRSLLLRTARRLGGSRLTPVWRVVYELSARGAGAYLRGRTGASVYARGGVAAGDVVGGLSDVDLVLVLPGRAREADRTRLRKRRERLLRVLSPIGRPIESWATDEQELHAVSPASHATFGLARGEDGRPCDRAAFLGRSPLFDEPTQLLRPGLGRPTAGWRLLAGPDRRAALLDPDSQQRRIRAWLELQYWWRRAFAAAVDSSPPHIAYLCVKLVSEPIRTWLWLAHGEIYTRREEALKRALDVLPEEETCLTLALRLQQSLHRSPDPPLDRVIPCLVRVSHRIAELLAAAAGGAGGTEVALVGSDRATLVIPHDADGALSALVGADPTLLPLVDWRALTAPEPPDEAFALVPGDPGDVPTLAAAAQAGRSGAYPALRSSGLLVLPTAETWRRALLRCVQCEATDPVPHALAAGRSHARFPELLGWSASDSGRRAVAEHRSWLSLQPGTKAPRGRTWIVEQPSPTDPTAETLGLLLTAARAAIFLGGLESTEPELPLTAAAVAERLDADASPSGRVAADAYDAYREARLDGVLPSARLVAALRKRVHALPPYAD